MTRYSEDSYRIICSVKWIPLFNFNFSQLNIQYDIFKVVTQARLFGEQPNVFQNWASLILCAIILPCCCVLCLSPCLNVNSMMVRHQSKLFLCSQSQDHAWCEITTNFFNLYLDFFFFLLLSYVIMGLSLFLFLLYVMLYLVSGGNEKTMT